jgi:hypothetical protein
VNELTNTIDDMITSLMEQIPAAAERRDFAVLEHLTKKASELRAMKDQVIAIEHRLRYLQTGTVPPSQRTSHLGAMREFAVEVTEGMINQSLLTLTEQLKRGIIHVGEKLTIETVPAGDSFDTQVLPNGNKLQERGKIGKFYRDASVAPGDVVLLTEITPGQWRLSKADIHRYRRV